MIQPAWQTARLTIRDAVQTDAPALQSILESIADTLRVEGKESIARDAMKRMIEEGELPPAGTRDRFRLQAILSKEADACVGYLGVYHGFPHADTLYICTLTIAKQHRGKGYGTEVVRAIREMPLCEEFPSLRLWVSLNNWAALRFWIAQGFANITAFTGTRVYGHNATAGLELESAAAAHDRMEEVL